MAQYHYLASDSEGKVVESRVDASSLEEVLHMLGERGLRPISVKAARDAVSGIHIFGGKITIADKVFLTKYLALMLQVGTDLLSAIDILIADFEKPAMKSFLLDVREHITRGQQLYQAFEKYPAVFSPVFISLLKAAEQSGNLQKTFEELSISLEKESELRGNVRSALIYPIVILSVALVIFIFLVTFALPKIANVFLQGDLQPPTFSRIVFTIGLFIGGNILWFVGGIIAIAAGLFFFSRSVVGKRILARMVWNMPVVGSVYRDLAIQRFAATLSSLIRAGLPILTALKITAEVVGAEEFRLALIRIADEGLAKGLTVGEAFRREESFPKVVTNLIAISERAGHLEQVLGTLADFYATRAQGGVKTIMSLLEPLLLLGMGGMVAVIALAIVIPIYQLTQTF